MNEQTAALLRDLAAKLGTTVEHLYGVVLRQVPVWIAANLAWAALSLAVAVFLCRAGWRLAHTTEDDEWNDPLIPKRACGVLMIVAAAACFGLGVMENLQGAATGWINPEFSALTYILRNVR